MFWSLSTQYCRKENRAGGVAIFMLKSLQATTSEILNVKNMAIEQICEVTAVKVILGKQSFVISGLYRKPNSCLKTFTNNLHNILLEIYDKNSFLLGDFNVDFNVNTDDTRSVTNQMETFGFARTIYDFTRVAPSAKGLSKTCIANIFTNIKSELWQTSIIDCLFSDHTAQRLDWTSLSKIPQRNEFKISRKINQETLALLNFQLSNESWETVVSETNPDIAYQNFIDLISYNLNVVCPLTKKKSARNKQTWNPQIEHIEAKITILRHQLKRYPTDQDIKDQIKEQKKLLRQSLNSSMKEQLSNQIKNSTNPKAESWKIINELRKGESENPKQITLEKDGIKIEKALDVANSFNDYYINLLTTVTEQMVREDFQFSLIDKVDKSVFLRPCTNLEVEKVINSLANKNSAGIDGISNNILKSIKSSIIAPLTYIINLCLSQGIFPSGLKKTIVKPLYKKKTNSK